MGASPASQADMFDHMTPIKEEPSDSSLYVNYAPPALENLNAKVTPTSTLSPLDSTQHSAAMLCDLQCRSSQRSSTSNVTNPTTTTSWWASLFLYLMCLQLQTTCKTLLVATWTHSPSQMVRLMQASVHRLTSRSTTSSTTPPLLLSRSMAALAQRNAATRPSARQGALVALQQRSVRDRRQRTSEIPAAAAEQQQNHSHQTSTTTKAFREQGSGSGMGTSHEDRGGVGS